MPVTDELRASADALMGNLGTTVTIHDELKRRRDVKAIVMPEQVVTTRTANGRRRRVVRWIKIITDAAATNYSGFRKKDINDQFVVEIDQVSYAVTDNTRINHVDAGFTDIELTRVGNVDVTSPNYYDYDRRPG